MQQTVNENVTVPAGEVDDLFGEDAQVPSDAANETRFNVNKLQAVLCMAVSALISIAALAWLFPG